MLAGGFVERDVASLRLPQWGRVVADEGVVPWLVVDPAGEAVEPIQRFLRDFVARGNRPGSVRSWGRPRSRGVRRGQDRPPRPAPSTR
ncbi:MAG TPA: hypothetical protein VMV92_29665 [Streptosporangiaceae bacterium]|nr:hypothetical protein [Streptosporangiaceae bacterium]